MTTSTRPVLLGVLALLGLAACGGGQGPKFAGVVRVLSPAESNCRAAVAAETGASGVAILTAAPAGGGTRVTLSVPGAASPWTCTADGSGTVTGLSGPAG